MKSIKINVSIFAIYSILYFVFYSKSVNLTIGPDENLVLFGRVLNNWKVWFMIMIGLFMKELIELHFETIFKHWYKYSIEEPLTKKKKILIIFYTILFMLIL